jgi:hypothetical protein
MMRCSYCTAEVAAMLLLAAPAVGKYYLCQQHLAIALKALHDDIVWNILTSVPVPAVLNEPPVESAPATA